MAARPGVTPGTRMRDLVAETDWSDTPFGPRDSWPGSLRTAVALCLDSRFPTCLFWGSELALLYNDGYREILAERHPEALGSPVREVWAEIWEFLQPLFQRALGGAPGVFLEDQALEIRRNGRMETAWFTFSLSPLTDRRGEVRGVFNTGFETTARVRAERALRRRGSGLGLLNQLRRELERATDSEEMVASAARVIGAHFGAQRCGFVEGEGECAGSEVTLTRGWRRNGGEGAGESEVRRLEDFAPEELVRVPASGEVVVVPAPHSAAAGAQDAAGSRTPSVLATPYLRNGRWRGALVVVDDRPREWGRENVALLREAATSLGMRLERTRGEEALRASEERYRTLYEAIDESYAVSEVVYDEAGRAVDYRFLQVNEAFEERTGLEDPVGRTARELVPEVEPVWIEQVGAIAEAGEPRRWVAEVRALGRWYDNFGFRLGGPDDRLVAVLSRDITMEKRAERALQATATRQAYLLRLNDALRPLTDPVVIQEVACRVLGHHLDVAWVQYSELDLEREIIENTREFYRGSEHPEDLPSHVGVYDLNAYPGHAGAWRSGWSMVVDDVETDPSLAAGERERLRSASVRATLTIPLMKDGAPVVVMSALSHRPRKWTAEDVGMLEETAERTWAAVGRARAEAALQRMNERLEARVVERTREVRQLAETLSLAEHAERQRLSHLLHDDLQQLLFGIQMKLGLGRSDLRVGRAEEALAAVDRSIQLLDEALTRTRQLTVELNPPVLAGEGLMDALEWLRRQVWDLHRLRIRIRGSTGACGLPADQRVLLFQIVRELLFNVAKHAGTDGASVEVERGEEGVRVVVRDAGRGFDPERLEEERRRSGFGLVSARERLRMRGGELVVDSAPGRGTRVELRLPADSS